MSSEIIIGLGGLVLSVLTYFAGVWRTERRYKILDKTTRMDAVFNRYMDFRNRRYTGGLDGLQKAGVATLKDDAEIRQLADIIAAHGEKHPLGGPLPIFEDVDLKRFFDYAARQRINFHKTSIEKIIEELRGE